MPSEPVRAELAPPEPARPDLQGGPVRCEMVLGLVPGLVGGEEEASVEVTAHLRRCLGCRRELVRYRRLVIAVAQLGDQPPDPPAGLVGEILSHLEEPGGRQALLSALSGRRLAYLVGIAGAAGAAGAVVLASRGWGRVKIAS
ncbi:MAG: hypothetical protein ACRDYD_08060 [Acidimicrobiales bacterium]